MKNNENDNSSVFYTEIIEDFNKEAHIDVSCRIHLAQLGETLLLNIIGTADKNGYQFLAEKALEIINLGKRKTLIIELSLCDRLSASPLGMIGLVIMAFHRKGGMVYLITKNDAIIKTLKIMKLDEKCIIVDDINKISV
jgi:anti-anti-sigma regulatory factor